MTAPTDSTVLTPELQAAALLIGREPAWEPAIARTVIEHLADHGLAVLGIEVMVPVEDGYAVWGWSGYELRCGGDWTAFVEQNAAEALRCLEKERPPDALIILTWVDREKHDQLHS